MFHRILVPLDESVRAESAIPVAACIARAAGGSQLFVDVVIIPPGDSPVSVLKPFVLPQEIQAGALYI